MIDVLKHVGAPGSILFLVVSVLVAVVLLRFTRRYRRVGGVLLALIVGSYVILALPFVSQHIAAGLPDVDSERPSRIETLIVLDGDNRRGRVRELQRALASGPPAHLWVLGDRWILDAMQEAGLSDLRLIHDDSARTTQAQMVQVDDIARHSPGATAVIASRLQAPRVQALIHARRSPVSVLPSPVDAEPAKDGFKRFVPVYIALRLSRDAIYEHTALVYYRWRGFIEP